MTPIIREYESIKKDTIYLKSHTLFNISSNWCLNKTIGVSYYYSSIVS